MSYKALSMLLFVYFMSTEIYVRNFAEGKLLVLGNGSQGERMINFHP